jgi:sec-independent protein translocase protein TatB
MFGLGMGEIIVILVVALLVLGPDKLPEAAKSIGKTIRDLRRHTRDLQDTIEKDEHIGGTVRELKSALRGDDLSEFYPPRPRLPEKEKPIAQGAATPETPAAAPASEPATADAGAAAAAPEPPVPAPTPSEKAHG